MMIYISCAKTMTAQSKLQVPFTTQPYFIDEARQNVMDISQFSMEELGRLLKINSKLAAENYFRYHNFFSSEDKGLPAILSYTGIVFKRLAVKDFSDDDFRYAQEHLLITSFLYGLLRPLDVIKNYRLEGDVRLPERGNISMFDYWKPVLTDFFIAEIKKQGSVLINLASNEMKELFDWKRVCREVRVITPDFQVYKNGKLSTVVIYAKMCRGEMTRFILKSRIENPEQIKSFEWEGFCYNENESSGDHWVFTMG
ncbi:peroxide stress protein YaaA [Bacteroides caecigallinarum]|uniref:peroxide stress protein YaaA n=1 Tax=Bacteroides caecigallinarum TaxID=1411144 RepID=UPI00195AF9FC|nr:peroxide stress protein YaaA [Bacteroides caecigallinarum]MBM6864087.1 peroxide stress protein YaaA [Bacteroides caecigallinarum]MBU3809091.1 peroxide stress protein YaaA [Candidatus Phocaeicola faecipullorum]